MRWLAAFIAFNLGLCALLLGTLWLTTDLFEDNGIMGMHGWIAMAIGVVLTSGLGVGLMSLVFYSHRSHADDNTR